MSTEYWLVVQAVPYFTKRLGEKYEVNIVHGARMFQLLFAGGWEPTKTHFTEIPDAVWNFHEMEAVRRLVPHISYEMWPLLTRLPEKSMPPLEPEDSMVPVLFRAGDQKFVVPLICDIDERNNGCPFLNVYFDLSNGEGPYVNAKGERFGEEFEGGGDSFHEFLLPALSPDTIETDFDGALREFLFDKLSTHALASGTQTLYKAWGEFLLQYERDDLLENQYADRIRELKAEVSAHGPELLARFNTEFRRVHELTEGRHDMKTEDRYRRVIIHMANFARNMEKAQAGRHTSEAVMHP